MSDYERRACPDPWDQPAKSFSDPHIKLERKKSEPNHERSRPLAEQETKPRNREYGPWSPHFATSAPYETPLYVPQPPKTAPPSQKHMGPKAPPTPPESLSNSSSFSSPPVNADKALPPVITAFPGTMSSRSRENSRQRTRSSNRGRSTSKHGKSDSANFGKRFKSAFKGIFTRSPIDESKFERIEDRHWTEEY
ncbi:hypothetical protein D0867_12108 [Hortaea werneckii]|uniref:Uncharacterized protein n=1 Tax=Hortaea werneckii TaxID=91943 RepID=A0A3M6Y9G7_HORWE|nr:hypothetical protein D0867_12108 [Hortaea werneckii]RMY20844.1 hypothetical protein D0866_12450 [Hortaea werneckii]